MRADGAPTPEEADGGFDPVAFMARLGVEPTDLSACTPDELVEVIRGVGALVSSAQAVLAEAVRVYTAQGWHRPDGFADAGAWAAATLDVRPSTGRDLVGVGRRLAEQPAVSALLAAGEISFDQARVGVRLGRRLSQGEVAELLEAHTVSQLEGLAARLAAPPPAVDEPDRPDRDGCLDVRVDPHTGRFRFRGTFDAEQGAAILDALDEGAAVLRATPGVGAGEPLARLRGQALVGLAASAPQRAGRRAEVAVHVQLADLVALDGDPAEVEALTAEAVAEEEEVRQRIAERVRSLRTRRRVEAGADEWWWDPLVPDTGPAGDLVTDGTTVVPQPLNRLQLFLCDARWRVVVHDAQGRPIGAGHSTRTISGRLFRVLQQRDHGCRAPGCPHRHGLNAHHIRPWPVGPTDPWNLVLLCPFHHGQVHDGHLEITGHADGALLFRWSTGTTRVSNPAVAWPGPARVA